jgi:hypothetical protein
MKVDKCPQCESSGIGDQWASGHRRMLQQFCYECDWDGPARVPEQLLVSVHKQVSANHFPGFRYEIFDKYGHILISSRSYNTEEEALAEMSKELTRGEQNTDYGPYTGVLWPAWVIVWGKKFTSKNGRTVRDYGDLSYI